MKDKFNMLVHNILLSISAYIKSLNIDTDLKYYFKILYTPMCWIRNTSTDLLWDFELNKLMAGINVNGETKFKIDQYTVWLSNVEVWIANYPYSYGRYHASDVIRSRPSGMPTRITVFKLRELENRIRCHTGKRRDSGA